MDLSNVGIKYVTVRRKDKSRKMNNFGTYKEYELAHMDGIS